MALGLATRCAAFYPKPCQIRSRLLSAHGRCCFDPDLTAGPHSGAIAQPFPDVCMALSTVWYLDDASESIT